MAELIDISVVISTYNRSEMLTAALDSLLAQRAGAVSYEVVVVDNNSTDRTRQVVESYMARGHSRLRYVFEPRQGISYGRNAGIASSRSGIVAFTDDDVQVCEGWVAGIKRAFDEHPEVDFVGGKVLPRWRGEVPRWLTRDHWWPLALLDYGEEPFYVNADRPICLPTANASFRREVFDRLGLFSPEFSGREDHEFLLRIWLAGGQGIYSPGVIVTSEVQPERLKKAYHRRWSLITGRYNSLMRLNDISDTDGRIVGERPDLVKLFGVPAFIYRNLLSAGAHWIISAARMRESRSLQYENLARYYFAYIGTRFKQDSIRRKHSALAEIGRFVKAFLRKKFYESTSHKPTIS